jgi:hypothetical protein
LLRRLTLKCKPKFPRKKHFIITSRTAYIHLKWESKLLANSIILISSNLDKCLVCTPSRIQGIWMSDWIIFLISSHLSSIARHNLVINSSPRNQPFEGEKNGKWHEWECKVEQTYADRRATGALWERLNSPKFQWTRAQLEVQWWHAVKSETRVHLKQNSETQGMFLSFILFPHL